MSKMSQKKSADQWFDEYGESHRNSVNKIIHWICVPAIVLSLLGMLWAIPVPNFMVEQPYLNWATLVILAGLLFYARLSITLAIGMVLFSVGTVWLLYYYESLNISSVWLASVIVFVVAWVGQFIGHIIEGKKPSFFKDVQFLLIGPIWLLGFIYRKLGIPY